jgi:cyclopropane fatty-acyl-phospholipid synthase-like methyltransferase
MATALQEIGGEVYAVEPFGSQYLERHGLRNWRSLDEIPSDLRFNAIVAIDVVEHVPTPWTELRKLKNLLVTAGWIYISTPNANASVYRSKWRDAVIPGHLLFFTPSSIQSMLSECGFRRPRRLRWFIPYSKNPAYRYFQYLLQLLWMVGVLRYIAFRD